MGRKSTVPAQLPSGITRRETKDGAAFRVRIRRAGEAHDGTFADYDDALAFRRAALAASRGEAPSPVRPRTSAVGGATVKAVARELLRGMTSGELRTKNGERYKPATLRAYRTSINHYVVPHLGGHVVGDLNRGTVQRWANTVAVDASPDAARKALSALRVIVRTYEMDATELPRDPFHRVTIPRGTKVERPVVQLTADDLRRIFEAAEADDIANGGRSLIGPLFHLIAGTGVRLGELLALTWEDVDLDARTIHVAQSVDQVLGDDGRPVVQAVKSQAGRRVIPISTELANRLRVHMLATGRREGFLFAHDRDARRPGNRRDRTAPSTYARAGDPYRGDGLPHGARLRVMEAAKFPKPYPTFHHMRHAYASYLLAQGATLHEVAAALGHADANLVGSRYGHALPEGIARLGELFQAAIDNAKSGPKLTPN